MEIDFDKMLHRPIRPGHEFDNLIPKAQNTTQQFEKSSKEILETDVFDTLKYINQWVDQYHGQMSKIAPLLKGKNHAETAKNIYSWLYNHFQYQLDKSPLKQRLFSPAAAWHHRVSGIDCKSFSLLASCILTELKIPHSLRMVKQKGVKSLTDPSKWIVNPNYWNHVYVVIPEGTKFHIIDATTHDNREVQIVTKHDHNIMIHQGLNAAYSHTRQRNGLGCACQGTSLAQHGLGSPATLQFAIANFHNYLNELERKGVSRVVTNKMLDLVRANVEAGIDPNMEEIFRKATNSNHLGSAFSDLFTDVKGQVKAAANQGVQNATSQANSAINNFSVEGIKFSDVSSAINGDTSGLEKIAVDKLKDLIPSGWFGKTFGAVFANGFNLSCFGASYTPKMAEELMKKFHAPHFTYLIGKINTAKNILEQQEAINRFTLDVYKLHKYYEVYKPKAAGWSSCARKAIGANLDFMKKLKTQADSFISQMTAQGATVKTTTVTPLKFFFTVETTGYNLEETKNNPNDSFVDFPMINLSTLKNPNATPNTQVPGTKTPIKGGSFTPINGQNINAGATKKESGITPVLVLSGIGIALKLLL